MFLQACGASRHAVKRATPPTKSNAAKPAATARLPAAVLTAPLLPSAQQDCFCQPGDSQSLHAAYFEVHADTLRTHSAGLRHKATALYKIRHRLQQSSLWFATDVSQFTPADCQLWAHLCAAWEHKCQHLLAQQRGKLQLQSYLQPARLAAVRFMYPQADDARRQQATRDALKIKVSRQFWHNFAQAWQQTPYLAPLPHRDPCAAAELVYIKHRQYTTPHSPLKDADPCSANWQAHAATLAFWDAGRYNPAVQPLKRQLERLFCLTHGIAATLLLLGGTGIHRITWQATHAAYPIGLAPPLPVVPLPAAAAIMLGLLVLVQQQLQITPAQRRWLKQWYRTYQQPPKCQARQAYNTDKQRWQLKLAILSAAAEVNHLNAYLADPPANSHAAASHAALAAHKAELLESIALVKAHVNLLEL